MRVLHFSAFIIVVQYNGICNYVYCVGVSQNRLAGMSLNACSFWAYMCIISNPKNMFDFN